MLLSLGLCWFVGAVAVPVWRVRRAVNWVQGTYEHVQKIGGALNGTDERYMQARAVAVLGGSSSAAKRLGAYLGLREWIAPNKHMAVFLLGGCGEDGVDQLIRTLQSSDPLLRRYAARSLCFVGPDAEAAVPALIKALEDPDPSIRSYAAEALGGIGPPAVKAVPALIRVVRGSDVSRILPSYNYPDYALLQARSLSIQALGSIDPEAAVILPVIESALGDRDDLVRLAAARTAWRLGPKARSLAPVIGKLRDDAHAYVQVAAARAHARVTGGADPRTIACLRQGLSGGGFSAVWDALDTVRETGLAAEMVLELIEILSRHRDSKLRAKVIGTLGNAGPRAKQAIPELEKVLDGNDILARSAAKAALAKIRGAGG